MPLEISSNAIGVSHLNEALKGLTDERGIKWKRTAMLKAGVDAFNVVRYSARSKSPFLSGLTKRSLTITKGKYNKISGVSKAFTSSGKIRSGKNVEYHIATTLKSSFDSSAPKNRKGKAVRYPFINEVGVPPSSYQRISKNGKLHTVRRTAERKPLLFQHKALGQNASRVVSIWVAKMSYYIGLYSKSTYKTLSSADKSFKRTGGSGKKWL